ncbi:Archaeal/vacuolar-type H+-ATPase subunit I [Thermoplasmatales archaeon BRNA1]|nr:Archaeal/vacuolar-type H+-ATPase subunit I [Thermoplasmatales archaeon BRNA1]
MGTKTRMQDAINAFYGEKAIHVIDHTTGDDGLSIGAPTEGTSKASERLLKVRAMEKELGIKKKAKTANIAVEDVQARIEAGEIESVEDEVLKTVDARNDLTQKITELNAKKKTFELLGKLQDGPTLDLYHGYRNVAVIVGTTVGDVSSLQFEDAEVFCAYDKKEGGVIAAFVKADKKDAAEALLSESGFVELQVPMYTEPITVEAALQVVDSEIAEAQAKIDATAFTIEALKEKYQSFLKGTDEELSIQVEKGSIPVRIAVSKYAYVMDAWVPTKKVDEIKAHLEQKLGDDVYVEFVETRSRKMADSEAAEPRFQPVPTKQSNGKIASEFEYATSLVAIPKYQEIDPTILIMVFLPLFFGFMVGDAGYAIPFIILGIYGLRKTHHKDWRAIALVFFFGGLWAFLFGFFFYGEMLGMHFVGGEEIGGVWEWEHNSVAVGGTAVTWDWLLGEHFPEWFSSMMAQVDDGVGIGKLEDVTFLLKLSIYIGIVHLGIGYVCGLYNRTIQHGGKEAFMEKGGIVLTFVGMIFFCYALTEVLFSKKPLTEGIPLITFAIGIVLLGIGVAINAKAESPMEAIIAIPEVIGNVLSYARLGAIAMSKAGMALAFNYIVFSMIMHTTETGAVQIVDGVAHNIVAFNPSGAIVLCILGLLLFGFLHLVVWTLAILSAGLHALRLQFVELMMKFYDGGTLQFAPLAEKRVKTFFSKKANKISEV